MSTARSLGVLTIDLIAKIGGFEQGMDRAARVSERRAKEIAAAQRQLVKDLESMWSGFGNMVTGALGAITVGSIYSKFIQETKAAEQEQAQLAAVLRSTGQAAGWSQEQLNDMASALSRGSTFSEGEINKAQARLLAYTAIVGKAVPETMQAIVDMSTRTGQSLEQSAEMLGKAINTPSAGMTSLRKMGFEFGEEQIKAAKKLEDAGRVYEAQQIVLQELTTTYGGAAKAARDTFGGALTALQGNINSLLTGDTGSMAQMKASVEGLNSTLSSSETRAAFQTFTGWMAAVSTAAIQGAANLITFANTQNKVKVILGTDEYGKMQAAAAGASHRLSMLTDQAERYQAFIDRGHNVAHYTRSLAKTRERIAEVSKEATSASQALKDFADKSKPLSAPEPSTTTVKPPPAPPAAPPASGGGRRTDNSAQEAAAQLAADLDAIKNSRDALLNTYRNSEQVLQAMRSAGLTEEREYYAQKRDLMDKQSAAEVKALEQTIARLQQEQLSGKGEIDNTKKIASAQAELARVREDAATQSKVLSIEEEAAFKRIENSILAAKQAAQGYLDTMNRGLNKEIDGAGMGNKARERSGRARDVDEQYERQRQHLLDLRRQTELISGPLGPEAEAQYQSQLKILNDANSQALQYLAAYYEKVDALQKDWKVGALEALANYFDETQNIAKQTEDIVTNAFKGMEDALVEFTKTGKLDMKSLVDSIMADFARMAIRSQITGPLADLMSGAIKGSGSSGGSGGGWLSSLFSAASGWFGGARANGGPVEAGRLYQVGERGDELYSANGKQYLIPGADGTITPNNRLRTGKDFNQTLNITVAGTPDRRTIDQIANETRRRTQSAARLA